MTALVLAIVGALAAAAAVGAAMWQGMLLRKQLENADRVRRASFYQGVMYLFIQLDFIFIENHSWRPYFYDNATASEEMLKQQTAALAEYIVVSQNMIRLTCRIRVCAAQGQFAELSERKGPHI